MEEPRRDGTDQDAPTDARASRGDLEVPRLHAGRPTPPEGADDKRPGAQERPLPTSLGDGGNVFDEGTSSCEPGDVLDEP